MKSVLERYLDLPLTKCSPGTSSISCDRELLRNANSRTPHPNLLSQKSDSVIARKSEIRIAASRIAIVL